MQLGFAHRGGKEFGKGWVLVNGQNQAIWNLVCTQRVVDGFHLAKCRVIGFEVRYVRLKINVVKALVGIGLCVHDRLNVGDQFVDRL